jgi:hypothetical protein
MKFRIEPEHYWYVNRLRHIATGKLSPLCRTDLKRCQNRHGEVGRGGNKEDDKVRTYGIQSVSDTQ